MGSGSEPLESARGKTRTQIKNSVTADPRAGHAARLDVAHGRLAEETAVLTVKLASAFVSHFEGSAGSIKPLREHALTCNVQTKLFLILNGAHGSKRAEMVV